MTPFKKIVCLFMACSPAVAFAVDYEKKIPHDKICVVEAVSSELDVYLKCRGETAILKTSVEMPSIREQAQLNWNVSTVIKNEIRAARARSILAMLTWSFQNQLPILVDFNESKTLLIEATMYLSAGSPKADAGKKLDL